MLTALAVELYLSFLRTEQNLDFQSNYSEKKPYSFMTGHNFFYQNRRVTAIFSQHLRLCTQKTTFKTSKHVKNFFYKFIAILSKEKLNSQFKKKSVRFDFKPLIVFSKTGNPIFIKDLKIDGFCRSLKDFSVVLENLRSINGTLPSPSWAAKLTVTLPNFFLACSLYLAKITCHKFTLLPFLRDNQKTLE